MIDEGRTRLILGNQRLFLNSSELTAAINGFAAPVHPTRYRLGLRAVNRAGLSSDGTRVLTTAVDTPWAATSGVEITVDRGAPICATATARLCGLDYLTSLPRPEDGSLPKCADISFSASPYAPVRVASGGVQSNDSSLELQFEGFQDGESAIDFAGAPAAHTGAVARVAACVLITYCARPLTCVLSDGFALDP